MSDIAVPSPSPAESASARDDGRASEKFELLLALILGIAALLGAFAALRASLLGDEVLGGFTDSTQYYNDGAAFEDQNTQEFVQDQNLFLAYASANFRNDADLAQYLRDTLFSEQLETAVQWWEEQEDAESPFEEGSPYQLPYDADIEEQYALGNEAYEAAKVADDQGDKFDQGTAVLAVTLFGAGIAALTRSRIARLGLTGVAIVSLVFGAYLVAQGQFG